MEEDDSEQAAAEEATPGVAENAAAGTGRKPDPQGGRVHNITSKVSVYEAEALAQEKKRQEEIAGKVLTDSEFIRLRLLNGGDKLNVNYPPPPVDSRREKRGSVPKPVPAAVTASRDSAAAVPA